MNYDKYNAHYSTTAYSFFFYRFGSIRFSSSSSSCWIRAIVANSTFAFCIKNFFFVNSWSAYIHIVFNSNLRIWFTHKHSPKKWMKETNKIEKKKRRILLTSTKVRIFFLFFTNAHDSHSVYIVGRESNRSNR